MARRSLAHTPGVAGPRPELVVIIRPGEAADIVGGGTVNDSALRRLACDADIRRLVMNADGVPLDMGRKVRTATAAQRLALAARDGGCVFPGCGRPPSWCHAHHLDTWTDDEGPTDLSNLVLLCSSHHHLVHDHGWTVTRNPDGTLTFTAPAGRIVRAA